MVALRHCDFSPSWKFSDARLSMIVAGQSALPVMPSRAPTFIPQIF
jgi:hypothetical protein